MITLAILLIGVIVIILAVDIAVGVLVASLFGSIAGFLFEFGWLLIAGVIVFKIFFGIFKKKAEKAEK